MTLINGLLASAVLLGLLPNALAGWWWADPLAGYVLVFYGGREALADMYQALGSTMAGGGPASARR